MLEPMELTNDAVIKVIGAGGGDGNAVEHIMHKRIEGVEFSTVNTDAQALRKMAAGQTTQIDSGITRGPDADTNPEVGRNAADGDRGTLRATPDDVDMMSIAAGMDGGIDAGAAPVVAEITKDLGILTVAVVTKPFNFEGKKRMAFAEQGITELPKHVDSLITIPNDRLLKVLKCGISLLDVFGAASDMLKDAVQGIAELITYPGLMDIDSADVRTVISEMGYATTGSGVANGEGRAEEAAEMAISSPLLGNIDLSGACNVLINIIADLDLRLNKFKTVGSTIRAFASNNATVAIGTSLDSDMNGELRVTVVVAGVGVDKCPEITLVTNKQVQQSVVDRYQQHDMAPLMQEQRPVAEVINDNTPQTTRESDYLSIPTSLRKQAD